MDVKQYLTEWSECYRKDFVENIMPFWMKNGLDRKHGGVPTHRLLLGRLHQEHN